MGAVFVTASGTGIGKTLVAAAILHQARAAGRDVRGLKPVATGWSAVPAARQDPAVLLEACGADASPEAVERIAPWRFAAPLSPNIAAAREGRAVDFGAVCAFCRGEMQAAAAAGAVLVIEGIGGAMVPLDRRHTVCDWIAALSIPAVLVAGSYLGALSHALTAASALAGRGIPVGALVVSDSSESVGLAETAATLADFLPGTPVLRLPRIAAAEPRWRHAPPLADVCLDTGGAG